MNPAELAEAQEHFRRFMVACKLDPKMDEHLKDTPIRFTKLVCENTANYRKAPTFTTDAEYDKTKQIKATLFSAGQVDSLVIEDHIPFSSMCAHHFAPFMGIAHIGYIPGDGLVGISKFARVLDYFCLRPQTQEILTEEVAKCLVDLLKPKFLAVMLEAEHTCVSCRGPRKLGAKTLTSKFYPYGGMESTRAEFLQLVLR